MGNGDDQGDDGDEGDEGEISITHYQLPITKHPICYELHRER
ncbi:hypothetical protein [Tolypothrix sp. LEGE 11397]|nr:hypothetical protein [Tolypothrix sp. LEGE 11397]